MIIIFKKRLQYIQAVHLSFVGHMTIQRLHILNNILCVKKILEHSAWNINKTIIIAHVNFKVKKPLFTLSLKYNWQ